MLIFSFFLKAFLKCKFKCLKVAKSQESSESYSRVGFSGGAHSTRSKKDTDNIVDKKEIKIEETLLLEEVKEEERPVYIKLKYDAKENETESAAKKDDQTSESKEAKTLREIFNTTESNKLVLFQIPEHLSLHDLGEGHIGKLKIRQSGRVELVFNDEKRFDVSLSVSGDFLQVKLIYQ